MTDGQRRQLLKDKYLQLERCILEFDGRALTIKAWSVTFSLATVAGAFAGRAPAVLLLAAFGSLMFWVIEGMWKTSQYAFYERINEIEDYFAGKGKPPQPLQIGRAWYRRWSGLGPGKFVRILGWPRVALPHAIVALLGVGPVRPPGGRRRCAVSAGERHPVCSQLWVWTVRAPAPGDDHERR